MDLKEILENHKKWLNGEDNGICADLCGADLRGANLCGADLCGANLCGADLCDANLCDADLCDANLFGADLCDANLFGANLRGANLFGANLCDANLCGADLRGADLCDADLCDANLCGADLRGANLCDADLRGVKQKIIHIKGSKHAIYAIDDDVRIGCQKHKLQSWLSNFSEIGKRENYTEQEISEYGIYLKTIESVLNISKATEKS